MKSTTTAGTRAASPLKALDMIIATDNRQRHQEQE
jgi:hypothetical protein